MKKKKKSAALLLVLIIMAAISTLALGISSHTITQLVSSSTLADSQVAYQAALSGVSDLEQRLSDPGFQGGNKLISLDPPSQEWDLDAVPAPVKDPTKRYFEFTT